MNESSEKTVWVFQGGGRFASAVFETLEQAEAWIASRGVSGLLTLYPLGESSYDWAVRKGYFRPKRPEHETPEFIAAFTSGYQHHHYENGKKKA